LLKGVRANERDQVLFGVTGSGKAPDTGAK
jgi:excinuclease UvrABC helicase subunit UvrB